MATCLVQYPQSSFLPTFKEPPAKGNNGIVDGVQFVEKWALGRMTHQPCAAGLCTELYRGTLKGKAVVVKSYRVSATTQKDEDEFVQTMMNEFRIWRTFEHPHIVKPLGVVMAFSRLPALVLPHFENGSVLEYLKRNPQKSVLPLALDVASAISYLHNLPTPVVHGSIRGASSNILVTDDGRAVLSDFADSRLSVLNCIVMLEYLLGPVRWMAPEILSPPERDSAPYKYTTQSDVYSFGMTLLEMFTLRRPFSHLRRDPNVIMDVVTGKRPSRPTEVEAPQLTDSIWSLVETSWAQNPNARPSIDLIAHCLDIISATSGLSVQTCS